MKLNAILIGASIISYYAVPNCLASAPLVQAFACADTLERADGLPRQSGQCSLAEEYCYEASGGAAVSHGAHCRLLPQPNAACADLNLPAGARCEGTTNTGLKVHVALP